MPAGFHQERKGSFFRDDLWIGKLWKKGKRDHGYSGLRPDEQAWMEAPEERLKTEDKGAIDLLRTTVRISKLGWRGR